MKLSKKGFSKELKALRLELNGSVDESVAKRLDEIIVDLENLEKDENHQYETEKLRLLGAAIQCIPAIQKAIEYLINVAK